MRRWSTVFVALTLLAATASVAQAAPEDSAAGAVRIIRDDYGVPHVYGSTLESLFYGVGYAQGQDRLWQADVFRRLGTGTSAELFGPGSLGGDIFARNLFGPPERRAAQFAAASPEMRTVLESYAAGMNAWIEEAIATGRLPVEYAALGLPSPRAWTVDDSIATFMFFASFFGWFGEEEPANFQVLGDLTARLGPAAGAAVFADTHWLNDPSAPTTAPAEGAIGPVRRGAGPLPTLPPAYGRAAADYEAASAAWERSLERAGLRPGPSSNALVIAPKLSADGHALLLGGPQMGYATPQINHEIGIHGAGFDVTGMELAGWPGTPIGVGAELAWTLTSGGSDNTDIYVEVLRPADPGQYLYLGQWRDLECRVEEIPVRGIGPVAQEFCASIHGPVVGDAPGVALTLKNPTRGVELASMEAWLSLSRARSIEDFAAALSGIAYNFNVLYADARGNIAYWHIGRIPQRAAGDNPWFPHDGTGGAEWQGFIPWEDMPRALNPEQGWLTSWNNKPARDWDNSTAGFWDWGPTHRVNTLINLLSRLQPGSATVATVEEINRTAGWTTDTPSGSADTVFVSTLLDELLAYVDTAADPRLPGVVALLESWDWIQEDADGDGRYDSPAVAIFNTWWQRLNGRVFADELGPSSEPNVVGNLVFRLLWYASPPPDGGVAPLPLLHDYLDGETAGVAVTGSLSDALDGLTAEYGSADIGDWLQPAARIHWAPTGVAGVPDTIWMNRGTYNQIVHLGMGPHLYGENVISPGQSGDPASPHFADQLQLYATWTYKPMRLDWQDLIGNTESVTRLVVR